MSAFAATFASERTKLASLRSTYVVVGIGILLAVLITVGSAIAIGETWGDWDAADRASYDPALFAISGAGFSGIFFAVLGVMAFASEYSSGMIRLTLTATPRRGLVLAAKAAVVTAITLVAGFVVTVGMFLLSQAITASYGLETVGIADGDTLRAIGLSVALGPVFPVLGVALAVLLRSSAGAVGALLGLIFGPLILGAILPAWFQDHLLDYFPGAATDSLSLSHLTDGPENIGTFVAILVLAGWLTALVGGAYLALTRRDA
jgi:ABC-2 type transport system permease protein